MYYLVPAILSSPTVIEKFDKDLLLLWRNTDIEVSKLAYTLETKRLVDIPKEDAINYVEMLNLIDTKEDGEYFMDLIEYNLNNEESLGLLLNALYLIYTRVYRNSIYSTNEPISDGLSRIFDCILVRNNTSRTLNMFLYISSKYLL